MKKIMFNDRYGLTKAVLEGKKTQTRRVVKALKRYKNKDVNGFYVSEDIATQEVLGICMKDYDGSFIEEGDIYPKYKVGEIVAVAQSYKDAGIKPEYIVGYENYGTPITAIQSPGWTNKMFVKPELMPHQIRITAVRVERLQDISDEDCLKEGINASNSHEIGYGIPWVYEFGGSKMAYYTPREAYAALIDKVSGKGTWDKNPYVFVYDFELIK
jgi:hypothetical protein